MPTFVVLRQDSNETVIWHTGTHNDYGILKNALLLTMISFDIDIISGKICPYCNCKSELIDSAEVYDGVSYGLMYICRNCNAYVGCHKGSDKSLGRLANEELRRYKHCAHLVFDMIWGNHFMSRYNAYTWLSKKLQINREHTHIGMFDVDLCKQVINLSSTYLIGKNSDKFPDAINTYLTNYQIEI